MGASRSPTRTLPARWIIATRSAKRTAPSRNCWAHEPHLTPFAQDYAACRAEWGIAGLGALAPADVTIIIDVLTFTTCVDVALGAGATILPYYWDDPTAAGYAARHQAELAGKRRRARYSLAPECYADAPAGLRCVLPSPNGARTTLEAAARSG